VKYCIRSRPPIEVEIDGVPSCLYCGDSVIHRSMDGPLVCVWCDMGCDRDGARWTLERATERYRHFRERVEEARTTGKLPAANITTKCCKLGCGAALSDVRLPFCDEHMKDPDLVRTWCEL